MAMLETFMKGEAMPSSTTCCICGQPTVSYRCKACRPLLFFYCLPVWSARAPAPFSYVLEKWIGLVLKMAVESALRNIEVEKMRVTNNNKIDCCSKM